MRIAVASQNYRTVTPHAGVTRRFLVYEAARGEPPREVDRIDLPRELAMREFAGQGPHPLDSVDVVIAGSAGPGFARRMAERGVESVVTSETDPLKAVEGFLAGTLAPAEADKPGAAGNESCYGVRLRSQQRLRRRARRREGHWHFRQAPV